MADYEPALIAESSRADRNSNLWVQPRTSTQGKTGLTYDVIDASGKLSKRFYLPNPQRAIAGFGNNSIYLVSRGATGLHIERVPLPEAGK